VACLTWYVAGFWMRVWGICGENIICACFGVNSVERCLFPYEIKRYMYESVTGIGEEVGE